MKPKVGSVLTVAIRDTEKFLLTELPRREGTIRPEVVTLLNSSFQSS